MMRVFHHTVRQEVRQKAGRLPLALARRLRQPAARWIDRTIALLPAPIIERRLRAVVLLEVAEQADRTARDALLARLRGAAEVQWVSEISGSRDMLLMLDCASLDDYAERTDHLLATGVRRYQSFLVKRELRLRPFTRPGS